MLLCLCGRWLGATGGRGQEKRDFSNAHPQTPAPLTATASHRHFPCARNVNPNTAFIHYKNLIFVWLLSLAVLINLNPTHAALRRCSCITSWWEWLVAGFLFFGLSVNPGVPDNLTAAVKSKKEESSSGGANHKCAVTVAGTGSREQEGRRAPAVET